MNGLFSTFRSPMQYGVPQQNLAPYYNKPFTSMPIQQTQPVNVAENIARFGAGIFQPLIQAANQGNSSPLDTARATPGSSWNKFDSMMQQLRAMGNNG